MDNICPSQIKARISEMIIYKQLEQVSKSLSNKDTHLPPMGASQWTSRQIFQKRPCATLTFNKQATEDIIRTFNNSPEDCLFDLKQY